MGTQVGTAIERVESRAGGSDIQSGVREGKALYQVRWSDATAYSFDAEGATGVPVYGAQLGSTKMYVTAKRGTPDPKDQTVWNVEVIYRTLDPSKPQPNLNPTTSTWSVAKNISGYPVDVALQKDLNNKICVNVVNEPFNPPITTVLYDAQVNINFLTTASSHSYNISQTLGCVNSAGVTLTIGPVNYIFPAGELRFLNFQIQEMTDQDGNKIASYTENFLWRSGGWVELRPNLSLLHRNTAVQGGTTNQSIERNMISTGTSQHETTEPWYLDTAGQQITATNLIVNNSFAIYSTASFTALLALVSG